MYLVSQCSLPVQACGLKELVLNGCGVETIFISRHVHSFALKDSPGRKEACSFDIRDAMQQSHGRKHTMPHLEPWPLGSKR